MKYIVDHRYKSILIATLFLLYACNNSTSSEGPLTIEDKMELLAEKQASLSTLQQEIESLRQEIVEASPELQEKAKLIDTLMVDQQDFKRYIDIQGKVTADDIANVVSEVPGRITQITVREGDYVKKGQIIAKIDLESINKQIAEVETSLSLALDVYTRQKRLWEQNIGSEVQYLQAKNNKDRLEKSLETLNYQMTKSIIYAPLTGTVDREILKSGEIASPGMPIISILNTRNIKIETDLPERFLTKLKRGDIVDIYFPSIDLNMNGKVTMMGRSIDPSNRTLKVEIQPSKYNSLLKPNLLAEIKVKEIELKDVVIVPSIYLLQQVDGQEYVYSVKYANNEYRTQKTYVTTGESSEGNIIVSEGLSPGNIIVSKGARNVSEGDLITFE